MKYDVYVEFWNDDRKEPDWGKLRRWNTYLTFRQKLCALYMLNKEERGKEKLKRIISGKEYRVDDRNKIYLRDELSELKVEFEDMLKSDHNNLPKYSTYLQIKFKLKKPYLSKDDDHFYITDNPIVKDKVFKLPMVRASTWKGALRFAAIKVFEDWVYNNKPKDKEEVFRKRARIVKLFGNEKGVMEGYLGKLSLLAINGELPQGEELKGRIEKVNKEFYEWLVKNNIISREIPSRSGRLFFYPTFFGEISLDVITPLSRETKTPVRGPIYFEIVRENAEGEFRLLYYPFDLIARGDFEKIKGETEEDMEFLLKALKKMFYEIGFSAKKTSGFGVVGRINKDNIRVYGFKSNEVKGALINILQS